VLLGVFAEAILLGVRQIAELAEVSRLSAGWIGSSNGSITGDGLP
jgi:hypothetical protein